MVSAIILAAGASRRMGRAKALLSMQGKSFVRTLVDLYLGVGVEPVVVVVGHEPAPVIDEVKHAGAKVVVNPNYESGQLSSVIAGITAIEALSPAGVILHPVDHPAVMQSSVQALISEFNKYPERIVVPKFQNRRGHPAIFPASLLQELKQAPADVGARAVVRAHPELIMEVPVNDAGILRNIDTPQEYEDLSRNM